MFKDGLRTRSGEGWPDGAPAAPVPEKAMSSHRLGDSPEEIADPRNSGICGHPFISDALPSDKGALLPEGTACATIIDSASGTMRVYKGTPCVALRENRFTEVAVPR